MLASILNAFSYLFKFGFDSSESVFFKQVNEEASGLAKKNSERAIEAGQVWRSPLDDADRYLEPVFLTVSRVTDEVVFYTTNYAQDKERSVSVDRLKAGWVFVE